MTLDTGTTEWDDVVDRDLWKQFLRTTTGKRLLSKALDTQPPLLAKGDINEILIRSGEVRGWSAAFSTLVALAIPEAKATVAEPENYPALTDDAAWEDQTTDSKSPGTPE